jgi:hypothetical protein
MSVTFTKLFASITESTIWCEPDTTRLCWITMLAMSDSKGRVWGSIPGLANRARVSVDAARTAINTLLSPDPDSRTSVAEGRRIEAIDGGWRLINHEKYRALRDQESVKATKREWAAKNRAKAKNVDQSVDNCVDSRSQSNSVDRDRYNAEAEAEAEKEKPKSIIAIISDDGVSATIAKELVTYRSKLGAPLTPRAWLGIKNQIIKANMSLEDGITLMMARAWRGFDATWATKEKTLPGGGKAFSC